MLATVGLRTRVSVSGAGLFPKVGYTLGSLATRELGGAPAHARLTGFRAQLAMRVER